MNGIDWPSPTQNIQSVEYEIKEILASAGVNTPSYPSGRQSCFTSCQNCTRCFAVYAVICIHPVSKGRGGTTLVLETFLFMLNSYILDYSN